MHIYVTGGTGFIGSHFLKAALSTGHRICALRRAGSQPVIPVPESEQLSWIEGDLKSFFTTPAFASVHQPGSEATLVHLAAHGVLPGTDSWESCFSINLHKSLRLWIKAAEIGISRLVICGSCFEYGASAERYEHIPPYAPLEPTGAYHASKAAASMAAIALAVERHLPLVILRPFHVFGDGEAASRFWPSLKMAASTGLDFPMTMGEQIRDFTPVETVANAFLRALELPRTAFGTSERIRPVIANVGTGKPQSVMQFASQWWKHWNASGKLVPGALPYRANEVMRYVPMVDSRICDPDDSQPIGAIHLNS